MYIIAGNIVFPCFDLFRLHNMTQPDCFFHTPVSQFKFFCEANFKNKYNNRSSNTQENFHVKDFRHKSI